MTSQAAIRVYLVDDHDIVRRGVASLLESDPTIEVIGQAGTATDALREVLATRPDVVILDNRLPDGSGVDVCREIRAVDLSIRVLILTAHEDPEAISAAISAGAAGYVLKSIDGESLVSGVRLVAHGHSLIDPSVARRVIEQMESHQRSSDVICRLTPQQRKIFLLLADGLTNRQMGERLFLAEKTIKNHVTGLLGCLGLHHRTEAALLAVQIRGEESRSSYGQPRHQPRARPAA